VGKIEAAHQGTLLLDEIGDMPPPLQAALLRVLDGKEVVRLGCNQPRKVDLSILCATHRDLHALVEQGHFREDLLFRIAGHTLHLLPLRERADFDAVLDAVLARFEADAASIPPALRAQLKSRPWRGNVRELVHAVQRALALREPGQALALNDFGVAAPARATQASAQGSWLQRATDDAVRQALQQAGGNVTAAAKLLGIGRATLYRRLQRTRQA
jgi:transcriptional regulator of acetoin/glycerol metabolism